MSSQVSRELPWGLCSYPLATMSSLRIVLILYNESRSNSVQSKYAVELCALLVNETYGDLTSVCGN
jgi:hypothetical protein